MVKLGYFLIVFTLMKFSDQSLSQKNNDLFLLKHLLAQINSEHRDLVIKLILIYFIMGKKRMDTFNQRFDSKKTFTRFQVPSTD